MLRLNDIYQTTGVKIGDLARFPLSITITREHVIYPYNWQVVYFTNPKDSIYCVVTVRLCDGVTKKVTPEFFNRYRLDAAPEPDRTLYARFKAFQQKRFNAGLCDCKKAHPENSHFYVTVVDGSKTQILFGPYELHGHALRDVDLARKIANEIDGRSHWYSFGTASFEKPFNKPGILEQYREKYANT